MSFTHFTGTDAVAINWMTEAGIYPPLVTPETTKDGPVVFAKYGRLGNGWASFIGLFGYDKGDNGWIAAKFTDEKSAREWLVDMVAKSSKKGAPMMTLNSESDLN